MFTLPDVLIKKASDSWIGNETIRTLCQSMAFIFETQVFDGHLAQTKRGYDLFSFTNWHARVVRTMHNEEGRANTIHLVNWRNLLQKFAVAFKTAVLGFT